MSRITRKVLPAACILALLLSACVEGPDAPPPIFSRTTEKAYQDYLAGRGRNPAAFIVSEDGVYSFTLVCPIHADHCLEANQGGGTIAKGTAWCEQRANTRCHVYARGKRVVWN